MLPVAPFPQRGQGGIFSVFFLKQHFTSLLQKRMRKLGEKYFLRSETDLPEGTRQGILFASREGGRELQMRIIFLGSWIPFTPGAGRRDGF